MAFGNAAEERRPTRQKAAWPGIAFIVEALLLLVFLAVCLAGFMRLFGESHRMAAESQQLEQALLLAQNRAEQFAADPAGAEGESIQGDLAVTCIVTPQETEGGTLYQAEITVRRVDAAAPEGAAAAESQASDTASAVEARGDGAANDSATAGEGPASSSRGEVYRLHTARYIGNTPHGGAGGAAAPDESGVM